MFRNLKIGTKILLIILFVALGSQLAVVISSYQAMLDLTHYSQSANVSLGAEAAGDSKEALIDQAEEYLTKIAGTQAELSNGVLSRVDDEIAALAYGIEKYYADGRLGAMLPLPDMTERGDWEDRYSATAKAYAVDPANSDDEAVMAYDPGTHFGQGARLLRTSLPSLKAMSDEEKQGRVIVSENLLPQNLRAEISLLSDIENLVAPIYISNDTMDNIYLGTASGISYRYSIYNSSTRYDPRTRPWYTAAVEAWESGVRQPIWLDTYVDSTGETCVTCAMAYTDGDGNILGVVSVDIYLTTINNEIIHINLGETGYAFVLDESGSIIMHPDYEDSKRGDSVPFDTQPLEGSIDESYRALIGQMTAGESGIAQATIDSEQYYVAFSTMATTGWSIGVAVEIGEIIQPSVDTKASIDAATLEAQDYIYEMLSSVQLRFIVIFAICAMLVFVFAFSLSRAIVRPVGVLTEGAQTLGSGDLTHRIQVRSGDEIGELASSFNSMADQLVDYIDNLTKVTAEKNRIGAELHVATQIQADMLPSIFPYLPDRQEFDIYATMTPAKEVGGDFYDFFLVDDTHLAVVMADVSGKGVPAALFMVIAKTLLKNHALMNEAPNTVLEQVNNQLCENNTSNMFVTTFFGVLDLRSGLFQYANAGHNPPLLYRKGEGFSWLPMKRSFVLAGMENMRYTLEEAQLGSGDGLYLYTDGVTEAEDSTHALYSDPRLLETANAQDFSSMTVESMLAAIRADIDSFVDGYEQSDDITMLMLLYNGEPKK